MREEVRKTIQMAWPSVLESVSVSLAGMIDIFMVSSISSDAVAAIGLTTQPKFLGLAFFIATSVAVSALVARRRGENKEDSANYILFVALGLCIVCSVLTSVGVVACSDAIISFSGSEKTTHELAKQYFNIIMSGMIFNVISLVINAAQRGAGNTKIAMTTNLVSNGINIVLNYLLINGKFGFPALGIKGAAIATVSGAFVASIMSVVSILRSDFFHLRVIPQISVKIMKTALLSIMKISYSVFFEQVLMRAGFMAVAIMAAKQGSDAMAAHQVAMNIMSLAFSFGDGMQSATVALIGQSLGRKEPQLAKRYRTISLRIGMVVSCFMSIVYFVFGTNIYEIFFDKKNIIAMGAQIMFMMAFIVLFQIIQVINLGCLRGAGDVLFTTVTSTISVTIIRPVVSYLLCYVAHIGIIGIWIGILMDQISRFTLTTLRFRNDKWTKIKI